MSFLHQPPECEQFQIVCLLSFCYSSTANHPARLEHLEEFKWNHVLSILDKESILGKWWYTGMSTFGVFYYFYSPLPEGTMHDVSPLLRLLLLTLERSHARPYCNSPEQELEKTSAGWCLKSLFVFLFLCLFVSTVDHKQEVILGSMVFARCILHCTVLSSLNTPPVLFYGGQKQIHRFELELCQVCIWAEPSAI